MSYEDTKTTTRNESSIPNSQIESMFMRVCTDEQMTKYMELIDKGHMPLATAYASNVVYKIFYYLVEDLDRRGGSIELVNDITKRKGRPGGK